MSKRAKVVLSVFVVLVALTVLGAGTFATFNAQTKNPGNLFADGTLVLSNTKQGGSGACLSTGGGTTDSNVNDNCDQLFNLSVRKPGDSASTNLTIKNDGSLAASALKVFSAACTNADASSETYHGTGLPCSKIQLYIQEYSDPGFTTPSSCVYGGATGASCNFSDTAKTLSAFQTAYNTSTNGLTIGSGLSAGSSAYLAIAVQLPSDADNSYQGRQATIDFTWYAEQ